MTAQQRAHAHSVAEVVEHLRRHGLSLDDLVEFGGEDLKSIRRAEKARRVERCWALMARLGVRHADLEDPALAIPAVKPSRRRGKRVFQQVTEIAQDFASPPSSTNLNEINGLANSGAPIPGDFKQIGEPKEGLTHDHPETKTDLALQ